LLFRTVFPAGSTGKPYELVLCDWGSVGPKANRVGHEFPNILFRLAVAVNPAMKRFAPTEHDKTQSITTNVHKHACLVVKRSLVCFDNEKPSVSDNRHRAVAKASILSLSDACDHWRRNDELADGSQMV
jgi:hypothetical protein